MGGTGDELAAQNSFTGILVTNGAVRRSVSRQNVGAGLVTPGSRRRARARHRLRDDTTFP